jgi:hypothetical protein
MQISIRRLSRAASQAGGRKAAEGEDKVGVDGVAGPRIIADHRHPPRFTQFDTLLASGGLYANNAGKTKIPHARRSFPMSYNVTVVFGGEREYEFTLHDADVAPTTKEQARSWLATEFEELECTPSNPMGKVLVLDMVLNVAKYGGESRFEQQTEWSKKFALMTAAALDRPAVRVDVASFVVG